MLKKVIMTLLVFIFYLLQCTLFKTFSLGSVSPNLLLILTFCAGFMGGRKMGMYVGILSGLILDLFYGDVLGFNTLLLLYIGYVNGMFNKMFYDEVITLPLALLVGSQLSYSIIYYVFNFLLRNRLDIGYYFIHIMLPELAYTVIISVLIYRLLLRLNRKLDEIEKRSATKFG
ncbi:rod shape-determining protein MreD [Lachnospiraceae bacterium HCP1S3_C3]|nr:rod shape-determining protein MreD [Lachnospiraceae bacterium]MDD6857231.1 rod shape-determining protein MreD [Lachnospiraceae bacterium]